MVTVVEWYNFFLSLHRLWASIPPTFSEKIDAEITKQIPKEFKACFKSTNLRLASHGSLKRCVNGAKTVGKHVGKLLVTNRTCLLTVLHRSHTPTWVFQHKFAMFQIYQTTPGIPWQSKAVCERRKNSWQTRWQTVGDKCIVFADCFCTAHTHQLEFANTSLPT